MMTSDLPRAQILDLSLDDLAFRILQHLVENPVSASRTYLARGRPNGRIVLPNKARMATSK
jgi:hypothetical protein